MTRYYELKLSRERVEELIRVLREFEKELKKDDRKKYNDSVF